MRMQDFGKQTSNRKALVQFGELVIFMPVEKPKDKGEARNRVGIILGLVDRSDEEWSWLVLFIACLQGSEALPRTQKASEA